MKGSFKLFFLGCNPFIYHQTLIKLISSKSLFQLGLGNKEHKFLLWEEVARGGLQGREAVMRAPGRLGGWRVCSAPRDALKFRGRHCAFPRHVAWDFTFIRIWNAGAIPWNQKNEESFKIYTFSKLNIINAYSNVRNIKTIAIFTSMYVFIHIEKNIILLTYCKCTQNQRVHSDIKNVCSFY